MDPETPSHPALDSTMEERVHYAAIIAAVAAADGRTSDDEVDELRRLCEVLKLPPETLPLLVASATSAPVIHLPDAVARLRTSDLRFTLLADAVALALADGRLEQDERNEIRALAAILQVSAQQVSAIEDAAVYAHQMRQVDTLDDEDLERRGTPGSEVAKKLAAVGVPVAAVLAVAPLPAVFTTAAAAVGATLGPVGAMLGLGVGSYVGVRWLVARVTRERTSDT